MTGKERAARNRRCRALEKMRITGLILLVFALGITLLRYGIAAKSSLGCMLLSAGAVLTTLIFLILLWSIPTFLRNSHAPSWARTPLLHLSGADPDAGVIRASLLQCLVLALLMTSGIVWLLYRT